MTVVRNTINRPGRRPPRLRPRQDHPDHPQRRLPGLHLGWRHRRRALAAGRRQRVLVRGPGAQHRDHPREHVLPGGGEPGGLHDRRAGIRWPVQPGPGPGHPARPRRSPPGITGLQAAADGTIAGSRPELNLISGTNVTVAAVDNPGANRVDVTINSTGGGGGGGGTPASTVAAETAYGQASAVVHQPPPTPAVTTPTADPALTSYAARDDRVHLGRAPPWEQPAHRHAQTTYTPWPPQGCPERPASQTNRGRRCGRTFAASDHRHAREGFGAVTPQTGYGAGSGNGSAGNRRALRPHPRHPGPDHNGARDDPDDRHRGRPGHRDRCRRWPTTSTPWPHPPPRDHQRVGDTAAAGAAATFAASDHRHSREAFAAPGNSAVADAATAGKLDVGRPRRPRPRPANPSVRSLPRLPTALDPATAPQPPLSHSDHTHGTPALPTTAQIGAAGRLTPTGVKTRRIHRPGGRPCRGGRHLRERPDHAGIRSG